MRHSSGSFPRFDRVLAAALCKPEHLRSTFGVRFNSYLESCELSGDDVRGRATLNMIACEYDTDRNAGAILTALELYNLPPPQENGAALRQWRDRVRYVMNVMNQIGPQDQPEPRLLAKWLYDRLKRHPLMRRHVDKVRDAPADSEARTFAWLWGRLETCLQESQQEANALSIQEALRRGPGKVKKEDANAMLAKPGKGAKGDQDGKGKGKLGKDGKGSPKGGGKPKGGDQPKGKHQDDKNKTTSKPSELTAAQKAEMPCIYFSQGKCYREKCPFKHASSNLERPLPKPTPNPKLLLPNQDWLRFWPCRSQPLLPLVCLLLPPLSCRGMVGEWHSFGTPRR